MQTEKSIMKSRARESTAAIEKMYITMRHLLNRGFYKPMGVSGYAMRAGLLSLQPEIYGTIAEEKAEINGLSYVLARLPEGITECRFINLTSDEGYNKSHFIPIIAPKRRRNCYRIDEEQMNIEITRGRSEIYDLLTHLTFLYIEADKICNRVLLNPKNGETTRDWERLEKAVHKNKKLSLNEKEVAITHVATILARTFDDTQAAYDLFSLEGDPDRFLKIVYNMGRLAIAERVKNEKRTITFSPVLRERIGHHIYGEKWANQIKEIIYQKGWIKRPLHLISSNMHSVLNTLYAPQVIPELFSKDKPFDGFVRLSNPKEAKLQEKVFKFAEKNGMTYLEDKSGAIINVQLFDLEKLDVKNIPFEKPRGEMPVLIVMDYAFGEQAYETVDELLKPYEQGEEKFYLNMKSISIMGKAGILAGKKGDIMIPNAHIFEGTSDNYPFDNELSASQFEGNGLSVYEGPMVTVLGTSLQNKDILQYFHTSTWGVIGLEMEGVHYQKAIQSASKIRKSISADVVLRYAYYASDNPLETGSTLASGGLGNTGVKPTYLITNEIIKQILK